MTFEEFLDTDSVPVILMYECGGKLWADTVCLEDDELIVHNDRVDAWRNMGNAVTFFEGAGAMVRNGIRSIIKVV